VRSSFYRAFFEYRYAPSDRFENELRLSAGRNWLSFGTNDRFNFDLNSYANQTRNTLRWRLADWLTLRAGLDIYFNVVDADITLPAASKEGDAVDASDPTVLTTGRAEGEIFVSPAAFVEVELEPAEGLLLVPGLRLDHFGRLGVVTLDPRLTVRWGVGESWTLKGGVGLFHQEPFFDETDASFGNPDLGPERAVHTSVGGELRPLSFLTVDATLFYKDLQRLVSRSDRLVTRDGEQVPQRFDNGGEGRVFGLELLVRHELANNFFGWLSYTLSRAERRDSGASGFRPFDFDQTHIFTLLGTYRLPENWEVGARWRYVTGNLVTPVVGAVYNADADSYEPVPGRVNSERVGAFHQLDLRVDKRWVFDAWILGAYLDLQNVYNRGNPEGEQYNFDYTQSEPQVGLPLLAIIGLRAEL
jgi:outer membrane receptor protein involved in Fe transport